MDDLPVHRSRPRWISVLPLIASLLAIVVGALLIIRPAIFAPATPAPSLTGSSNLNAHMPKEGEVVPDFQLATLDGRTVKLSDLRGHPVLINFWATWCGPCKEELPLIVSAYNANKAKGFRVLAIDSTAFDNLDDIRGFVAKFNMTFDVLTDSDDAISTGWNIIGLPSSFFVRADGTLAKVHVGQMTADQLNEYMKLIVTN